MDLLAEYVAVYGGTPWVRPDGFPRSWRHYVFGLAHLRRATLRESLRQAEAVSMGQAEPKAFQRWAREVQQAADN